MGMRALVAPEAALTCVMLCWPGAESEAGSVAPPAASLAALAAPLAALLGDATFNLTARRLSWAPPAQPTNSKPRAPFGVRARERQILTCFRIKGEKQTVPDLQAAANPAAS